MRRLLDTKPELLGILPTKPVGVCVCRHQRAAVDSREEHSSSSGATGNPRRRREDWVAASDVVAISLARCPSQWAARAFDLGVCVRVAGGVGTIIH